MVVERRSGRLPRVRIGPFTAARTQVPLVRQWGIYSHYTSVNIAPDVSEILIGVRDTGNALGERCDIRIRIKEATRVASKSERPFCCPTKNLECEPAVRVRPPRVPVAEPRDNSEPSALKIWRCWDHLLPHDG